MTRISCDLGGSAPAGPRGGHARHRQRVGHHAGRHAVRRVGQARRTTRASCSSGSSSWRTRSPSSPTATATPSCRWSATSCARSCCSPTSAPRVSSRRAPRSPASTSRQRGQQALAPRGPKKNIDVEIDPRYGPGTAGKAGGGDGSISRPVSPVREVRIRRREAATSSPRSRPSCAAADLVTLPVVEHPLPVVELPSRTMAPAAPRVPLEARADPPRAGRYLLEETHETLEAIDSGDRTGSWDHLREELGDLLLQVYFHAVIAEESGTFDIDDVAARHRSTKMHRRNPHVFGDPTATGGRPLDAARGQRATGSGSRRRRSSGRTRHRRPRRRAAGPAARRQGARPAGRAPGTPVVGDPATDLGDRLLALVAEAHAGRRRPRAGAPRRRTPGRALRPSASPRGSRRQVRHRLPEPPGRFRSTATERVRVPRRTPLGWRSPYRH